MSFTPVSAVPGFPIFAQQINAVQENFSALANGEPGAPKIQQAAIGPGAIGQSQLKSQSSGILTLTTNASGGSVSVILPGGQYGFWPQSRMTGLPNDGNDDRNYVLGLRGWINQFATNPSSPDPALASYISLSSSGGTAACQVSQRYTTASAPYDIGNGDIPLFVFIHLDAQGKILATYIADSPPWAYNGPTDISPDVVEMEGGRIVKKKKVIDQTRRPQHPKDGGDPEAYVAWLASPSLKLVEIDHSIKNADMNLIPHPFPHIAQGEKVVLLEPSGKMIEQLTALKEAGENISELITEGYILIGDEILDCYKPNNVCIHRSRWKGL